MSKDGSKKKLLGSFLPQASEQSPLRCKESLLYSNLPATITVSGVDPMLSCVATLFSKEKTLAIVESHTCLVIAFSGSLGAGKSTLIRGLLRAWGLDSSAEVPSPTFSYMHSYSLHLPIHHFDLYRLSNPAQFIELGFADYFEEKGIMLIEWPERISSILPPNTLHIQIDIVDNQTRRLSFHV